MVIILRSTFGEATPAAPDLEHIGVRRVELFENPSVLPLLRLLEALCFALEQSAGIGHAFVEPERIKVVADVVVVSDVAPAAAEAVPPDQLVVQHHRDAIEGCSVRE